MIKALNIVGAAAKAMRGRGIVSITVRNLQPEDKRRAGSMDAEARVLQRLAGKHSEQANRLVHMARSMKGDAQSNSDNRAVARKHNANTMKAYAKQRLSMHNDCCMDTELPNPDLDAAAEGEGKGVTCTSKMPEEVPVDNVDLTNTIHAATLRMGC